MAQVRDAFAAGHRRVLLVLPTAAGKTVCFAWLVDRVRLRHRVAVVASRRQLILQASAKLGAIPHGIIMPGHPMTKHNVQVGSVQTMTRRTLDPFGVLIVDEAHHMVSGDYERLLAQHPAALVLGVTATPERLDGRGLGEVFTEMVIGPSVAELTTAGYLCPVETFAPAKPPDIKRVHMQAGDYMTRELALVMDKPTITGDAVAHYQRHAAGLPAIAFCVSVQHAVNTAAAFEAEGWSSVAVHGGMKAREIDPALAGLASGRVSVLTSCSLIDEGVDIPDVGCVIDLAPTQSRARYKQKVGRGMRLAPGKASLKHLDHAGNVFAHGLPDHHVDWTLDGVPRRNRAVPAVAQCPDCFAMHHPGPVCPACGYSYEQAAAAAAAREAIRVEGELALMTLEDHRLAHLRGAPLRDLVKGAATYDDLAAIADARGYNPAWVRRMAGYKHIHAGPADGTEFDA